MDRFIGIIGIAVLLGIAYVMSNNRKAISMRIVLWGLCLQLIFAIFILKTPIGQPFFKTIDSIFFISFIISLVIYQVK